MLGAVVWCLGVVCTSHMCWSALREPRPRGIPKNHGGNRSQPYSATLPPTWVSHCPDGDSMMWMYDRGRNETATRRKINTFAYDPGYSLIMPDEIDLRRYLIENKFMEYANKGEAMHTAQRVLWPKYRSIVFTHHADGFSCPQFYLREIVYLGRKNDSILFKDLREIEPSYKWPPIV